MVNIPFVFGLGFFLRVFVPGLVAASLFVIFRDQLTLFRGLEGITIFLLLSGLLGLVLRVLYPFASEFLFGAYWPSYFRIQKTKALEKRLQRAEETLKSPPKEANSREGWKYVQAGRYVLLFPIDQSGKRSVLSPTLIGNIMGSYLSSLSLQYGLKFLGSRAFERHMTYVIIKLWFALPRRIRQDVSDFFAESEAVLGCLTAVVLGGIAFLGRGLFLMVSDSWAAARGSLTAFFLLLALAWLLHQVLQKHATTAATTYEALLGYVSRAEIERIIEDTNKAIAAQGTAAPGGTQKK